MNDLLHPKSLWKFIFLLYIGLLTPSILSATSVNESNVSIGGDNLPVVTDYIHCTGKLLASGQGLQASPSYSTCVDSSTPTINWWDAPYGGNLVGTGSTFVPNINYNTAGKHVYYAEVECIGVSYTSPRVAAYVEVLDCTPVANACTYFLVLKDSNEDGWNGASIAVTENEASSSSNYTISHAEGGFKVVPLTMVNGGILDFFYTQGGYDAGNSITLLDPLFNIATDVNGNPFQIDPYIPSGNLPRVKIDCPEGCADGFLSANIHIGMGDFPAEQSWELIDSQGNRLTFANGNFYNGLAPGTNITVAVELDMCETYTFTAFDGANDGWSSGAWTIYSANGFYGTELTNPHPYEGYFSILSGPSIGFDDEESMAFTIPCTTDCPDEITGTNFDFMTCTGEALIPVVEPKVCYPNCNHALGCTLNENIFIIPNGIDGLLIEPIPGGFDPNNHPYAAGILVNNLPIGKHELIHEITYCDGQIARCVTHILISSQAVPSMICKTDITVTLGQADAIDNSGSGSLLDDIGECLRRVAVNEIISLSGPCAIEAQAEYELIILDENDNPIVQNNANGHPYDISGNPILPGFATEPAHDIVGPDQIGQNLKYRLTHLLSGFSCCGTIELIDHNAPVITCNDYAISCTHPDPLNENYSVTKSYIAADLPANIAGGDNVVSVSITELDFEIGCGSLGETINDIAINLNIEHTDIEDLRIVLTPPALSGLGTIELMPYGTCPLFDGEALNMNVSFVKDATASITDACDENDPILSGAIEPSDLSNFSAICGIAAPLAEGTWTITILDNDDNGKHDAEAGVGQVVEASLVLTTGFPEPITIIDCSETTTELEIEMVLDNNCNLTDWVGSTIMRVWKVTDIYGNSSTCTQTVLLKAPTFTDIEIPENRIFNCSDIDSTEPTSTGYPMFGCYDLTGTDEQEQYCDVSVTYSDAASNGCNQRIIRTWTITNWCTTASHTYIQTIDIVDDKGPEIEVEDATISASVFTCTGSLFLNPTITDACSDISQVYATYTIEGESFIDVIDGPTLIENLPLGDTEITISAKDACTNTSTTSIVITVIDDIEPTASCDDELIVTLNGAGSARLLAIDINEGSNDNCGIDLMEVRRIDGCLGETAWDNYVDFACCDIGTPVMVQLRVTDIFGNSNTCTTTLDIFDETAPRILCPADKLITCEDSYGDLSVFGTATAIDNCEATVEMTNSDISVGNCGAGYIKRTFTATDLQGLTDVCTQTIVVESVSGYVVTFPEDVLITDCNATVENTGEPVLTSEGCGLMSITKEDELLTVVPDACYKIKRTWMVMDWCLFEDDNPNNTTTGTPVSTDGLTFEDDGDGYTEYVQYIKILDNVAPVIDCPAAILVESVSNNCYEEVSLSISATDNCSRPEAFDYDLAIDLDNDGTYDVFSKEQTLSYNFGFGTHRVFWEVSDGCGNKSLCEQLVTVVDKNHPSVACADDWSVQLIDNNTAQINAADVFQYAEDNCASAAELAASVQIRLTGSTDPLASSIAVDCDDTGFVSVEIWVEDNAGNTAFCTTSVEVEDVFGNCTETGARVSIAGYVRTEDELNIENAMVEIMENDNLLESSSNGNFGFNDLPMYHNYTLSVTKNDDYLNGVSTADLVYINQHILGLNTFESPCQIIAADINNDNKVSTFDLVILRQLILYIITELPNNNSWRFVDKDYVFPNPQNPWLEAFPEHIYFNQLQSDEMHTDFVGIKIGDVNSSAVPNTLLGAEERNMETTLFFEIEDKTVSQSETICIPFIAKDFNQIEGFQYTLSFDQSKVQFVDFEAGTLDVSADNFGFQFLEEGVITTSWNTQSPVSLDDNAVLFSLCFEAQQAAQLSDVLDINSRYTTTEAYGTETMDIDLTFSMTNTVSMEKFELYQNTPNPFNGTTNISFNLPEASMATIKVFDTAGKIIESIKGDFDKGINVVTLKMNNDSKAGIFFYEVTTAQFKATKKMVLIK